MLGQERLWAVADSSLELDRDSSRCQKLATYRSGRTRAHPLHSEEDCEVFPRKSEEIHYLPSDPVVAA